MRISSPSLVKQAWRLTKPYWTSKERWPARILFIAVLGLSLGSVYLDVLFNDWNNDFYNSLQGYDFVGFWHSLFRFTYLAAAYIAVIVYSTYLSQMLRIRWRRWMTQDYLSRWLAEENFYRMQLFGSETDNPDQRISQDVDQFIQITLELSVNLISQLVKVICFSVILWDLSGVIHFALHGISIDIPGYMLWIVLLYSFIGTWLTFRIGRPLVRLNFEQQRYEANFRYSLVRLRENSESVAFYRGETQEGAFFTQRFSDIVGNYWKIMKRQKRLNWFTSFFGQFAVIFPFIFIAPRYFAKQLPLGGMMQTVSAFGHMQTSASYLVDSYTTIATLKAVVDRLTGFNESIRHAEAMRGQSCANDGQQKAESIEVNGVTIRLPDGNPLLQNITLSLKLRDTLLITGISGTGKSTLLRALAGLWPFTEGTLSLPERDRIFFLPQRPYMPLGSLRQALCYPAAAVEISEEQLKSALSLCGLQPLSAKLNDTEQWSNILSLGEQQRVGFARILLAKPDFIFLDEATSALDEPAEKYFYELLARHLPEAALVSVGHRSTLRAFHVREMVLGKE